MAFWMLTGEVVRTATHPGLDRGAERRAGRDTSNGLQTGVRPVHVGVVVARQDAMCVGSPPPDEEPLPPLLELRASPGPRAGSGSLILLQIQTPIPTLPRILSRHRCRSRRSETSTAMSKPSGGPRRAREGATRERVGGEGMGALFSRQRVCLLMVPRIIAWSWMHWGVEVPTRGLLERCARPNGATPRASRAVKRCLPVERRNHRIDEGDGHEDTRRHVPPQRVHGRPPPLPNASALTASTPPRGNRILALKALRTMPTRSLRGEARGRPGPGRARDSIRLFAPHTSRAQRSITSSSNRAIASLVQCRATGRGFDHVGIVRSA